MKTMKVIDLLVDIANNGVGEEIKYFKHFDRMRNREYTAMINLSSIIHKLDNGNIKLNDPIDIVEDTPKEDNKIKKIDISKFPKRNNSLKKTALKVNEIIDYINNQKPSITIEDADGNVIIGI